MNKHWVALAATLALTACGSGSKTTGTPPAANISTAVAARFLRQASFGPTAESIADVQAKGYSGWIDAQLKATPNYETAYVQAAGSGATQADRVDRWFQNALHAPDQLRQRVAFALSEIFVISDNGALGTFPLATSVYYDLLTRDALGNFRDLMGDVTRNPAMGIYLSMLGNQKPDAARNIRPDENYARELLQLFTIGLVQLNADGTVKNDANGAPIPTYDQPVVEGFAHVYTGWNFAGSHSFYEPSLDFTVPMVPFADFHDTGAKVLLDGKTVPAGQSADADLDAALDIVFAHPNVGPFIAKQLIQRLVSSNPSPAYVARVGARFDDNGSGVRGDLAAVVRAILLDDEARSPPAGSAGKLMEPLVRLTSVWRAFDAKAASGKYRIDGIEYLLGEAPLRSPSVFNFFRPDYSPPGELRNAGILAPELQITNESTAALTANVMAYITFSLNSSTPNLQPNDVAIDISHELADAADAKVLVDRVAAKLTGGALSSELRDAAVQLVELWPQDQAAARVAEAIHLIAISPEYATLL